MAVDKIINNIETRLPLVGAGCRVYYSFSSCVNSMKSFIEGTGVNVTSTITNMEDGTTPSKTQVFYLTFNTK